MSADDQETYQTQPTTTIIERMAETNNVDPADLPPLYRAIDPEALDAIFHGRPIGRVEFEYMGFWVTVVSDEGEMTVETNVK